MRGRTWVDGQSEWYWRIFGVLELRGINGEVERLGTGDALVGVTNWCSGMGLLSVSVLQAVQTRQTLCLAMWGIKILLKINIYKTH